MNQTQRTALAASLYNLRPSARYAKQIGDQIDGWVPERMCHDNVARWLKSHRLHRAVRGWLYAEYMTPPSIVRFLSHSIVATETGEWIDVTFGSQDTKHPFIEHPGDAREFLALVANNGCAWIDLAKPAD